MSNLPPTVSHERCPYLVNEDDLKHWLGIQQRTRLEKKLCALNISYCYGAGNRICTTIDAVNNAVSGQPNIDGVEFVD